MRLRRAASLWIAAVTSATYALADVRAVRTPPSFTPQEIELIGKDERLIGVVKDCAWQIRQALELLPELSSGYRVGVSVEPCQPPSGARASDEGALDILKILKDASDQGSGRSTGDLAGGASQHILPAFTVEEVALIYKSQKLRLVLRHCAWHLRHALDNGAGDWPPQRPCSPPRGDGSTRGNDEGALDIMKILRDASGQSTNN